MNIDVYALKSKEYEKSLNSAYKKDNGIFYTDIELSRKIIKFLSIPIDATILDPCCGTASFILAAKSLGYSSIYGADIDKKAITLSKKEFEIENLKVLDTLANDATTVLKNMKLAEPADFVIGNPPYAPMVKDIVIDTADYLFLRSVKDSGSNLFVAALYRAFDLAKADGVVSYIIPKNFLHVNSYSVLRKKILNEKTIVSIIDLGACFKSVRGEQIVLTIQNSHNANRDIAIYNYVDNDFVKKLDVPQKFYSDEILLFESKEDYNIYQKLENSYKRFNDICTGYVGRGKSKNENAICGKDIRKFSFKEINVPKKGNTVFLQNIYSAEAGIIASFAGDLEASETVTVFTDGDEKMCRYILGFLHSRLCNYYLLKFCFNNSRLTMHTDAKYLRKLPLVEKGTTFNQIISVVKSLEVIEYMCDEWFEMVESLNKLVYQTYGIDEKECDYIDERMKEIQSQRWNNDKRR